MRLRSIPVDGSFQSFSTRLLSGIITSPLELIGLPGYGHLTPTKTSAYTAVIGDVVSCDVSAGGFTVHLPEAPPTNSLVTVRKHDTSVNAVTVQRSGSDVIGSGASVHLLEVPGETVTLQYEDGVWDVVSVGAPTAAFDTRYYKKPVYGFEAFEDHRGNPVLQLTGLTSADDTTPYIQINNGTYPAIRVNSPGTTANLGLSAQGTSGTVNVLTSTGYTVAQFMSASAPPNYVRVSPGASAGSAITILATGSDTNVDGNLTNKGAGTWKLNGAPLADISTSQTFTNKTISSPVLVTPKISTSINDVNGNVSLFFTAAESAVNHVRVINAATGSFPIISSRGGDTDTSLAVKPSGTGNFYILDGNFVAIADYRPPVSGTPVNGWRFRSAATGSPVTLEAISSTDTDVDINAIPQNAGQLKVAGTPVELTSRKGVANGYAPLNSGGKIDASYLPSSAMEWQGVWNASTNTPTLADGTGSAGDVYRVSVAGTRNLGSGSVDYGVGDLVIYDGSVWQRSDSTDAVTTVNGYSGAVTLAKADIGLGSVDNTSDLGKPISTLTQAALDLKANAASPTFTGSTIGAASSDYSWHNVADTTTNYERARAYWSSNVFNLAVEKGGTGTARHLRITGIGGYMQFQNGANAAPAGTINANVNSSTAGIGQFGVVGNLTSTSGTQYGVGVGPTINQSSTAGYTALLINPTETATGSGTKRLIDAQVGGTSKFTVDNTGTVSVSGTTATWRAGVGSPEGAVTAAVGSLFTRTDGGGGSTLYVKESGSGNTGWVAK